MIALDVRPGEGRWAHDGGHGVENVGAWLGYRLRPWTSDGEPRRSPSQRLAQQHSKNQARRRAEAEQAARVRASQPRRRERRHGRLATLGHPATAPQLLAGCKQASK